MHEAWCQLLQDVNVTCSLFLFGDCRCPGGLPAGAAAPAEVAIGFMPLCDDKANLAVLRRWVGYSFIPGCFALPKVLTPIQLEIILFFISPNFWTHSSSHTSRLLWTLCGGGGWGGECFAYSCLSCSLVCGHSLPRLSVVCRIPKYQEVLSDTWETFLPKYLHWVAENKKTSKELVELRA